MHLNNYRKSGKFQVAKISLFLEDRGVNHIKYLISVYKALQIAKIVKISTYKVTFINSSPSSRYLIQSHKFD